MKLDVPLQVEVGTGDNWDQAHWARCSPQMLVAGSVIKSLIGSAGHQTAGKIQVK